MDIKVTTLLLTAFLNSFLGFYILFKNSKRQLYLYYIFITLGIVLWSISSIINNLSQNYNLALYSTKVSFGSALVFATYLLLFAKSFPDGKKILLKEKLFVYTPSLLFLIVTLFSNLVIRSVVLRISGIEEKGVFGPLIGVFFCFILFYVIFSLLILLRKYSSLKGIYKKQLGLFITGAVFAVLGGIIASIILPFCYHIQYFAGLGSVPTTILVIFVFYAIIKYRFLELRIAVRRILSTFLTVTLLCIVSLFLYLGLMKLFNSLLLSFVISEFLSVLLYPLVLKIIKNVTDKFLFQKDYQEEELIINLGKKISSVLDIEILVQNISIVLKEVLKAKSVVYVLDNNADEKLIVKGDIKKNVDYLLLVTKLGKTEKIIVLDELMTGKNKVFLDKSKELIDFMNDYAIEVVVPLLSDRKRTGYILVGPHQGDFSYSLNDINIMENLGIQAGIAIENALLYSEIKQFTKKLQDEVNIATKDLKETNNKLLEANKRLQVLDEMKQEFVPTALAEIKVPLVAIKNYLWMLMEGKKAFSSLKKRKIEAIISQTNSLLEKIRTIGS